MAIWRIDWRSVRAVGNLGKAGGVGESRDSNSGRWKGKDSSSIKRNSN